MVTLSLEEPALALARALDACALLGAPADFHTASEPASAQTHADLATYLAPSKWASSTQRD